MHRAFLFTFIVFLLFDVSLVDAKLRSFREPLAKNAVRAKKYALVIGINGSNSSKYWPLLRYAKTDAHQMKKALRVTGKFDRIWVHTRPNNTTTQYLKKSILRLKKLVKSSEDTVVLYISAHGTVSRNRRRFIITSNTSQHVPKTALPVEWIRKKLLSFRSKKIALILATCYTGSVGSKAAFLPGSKGGFKPAKKILDSAIQILSAASYAQAAFESTEYKADVYTHFWLKCFLKLKQKSIIRIHTCASHLTTPYVRKLNGQVQVPKVFSVIGANRDFFLFESTEKKKKSGYFLSKVRGGKKLLFRIFRPGRKSGVNAVSDEYTALPAGRYQVVVQDSLGATIHQRYVDIEEGQVTQLLSDWSIEFLSSSLFSKKGGADVMWGGGLSLVHPNIRFSLGMWGNSKSYQQSLPSTQVLLGAQVDLLTGWYRPSFDLVFGVYLGVGVLAKHLLHAEVATAFASAFDYGVTTRFSYWFSQRVGLTLQLSGGFSLYQRLEIVHQLEGSAHLGLRFRM